MARSVKDPDERRSELIRAAQRFFYTKGYRSTSISDIVKSVGVAQGTFYYYFDSKQAILDAMIDDLMAQAEALLRTVADDPSLTALPKWRQAFGVMSNWKLSRKEEMLATTRFMMSDENVLLRHKLQRRSTQMTARHLAAIIEQGVSEGVFSTPYPLASAEIVMSIFTAFSDAMSDLLLHPERHVAPLEQAWNKHEAMRTAIERVLGAPAGSLPLIDKRLLSAWFEGQPA